MSNPSDNPPVISNEDRSSQLQPSSQATMGVTSKEKRKAMSKRPDVWDHFIECLSKEGDKNGRCKYCAREFYADPKRNGTSSSKHHISVCKKHPHSLESKQTQLKF